MPDLLSHIIFCLIACELVNFKKKGLILLGAILPDIITKIYLFGFIIKLPEELIHTLFLFHGVIPIFLVTVLIGLFFRDVFSATYLIGVGALSHLLLDLFNGHFLGGLLLLFPISWNEYRISIYWPNQYFYVLVILLGIYGLVKFFKIFSE